MCVLLGMADGSQVEVYCPGRTAHNPCPVVQSATYDQVPDQWRHETSPIYRNMSSFNHVWRG